MEPGSIPRPRIGRSKDAPMSVLLAVRAAAIAALFAGPAHATSDIVLTVTPAEAAAVQDAMDARARSMTAPPDEFWQVEIKLGEAIAASAEARDAYAKIIAGPSKKGTSR